MSWTGQHITPTGPKKQQVRTETLEAITGNKASQALELHYYVANKTGYKLRGRKLAAALKFDYWPANSSELNIAEHAVSSVKYPSKFATGSYPVGHGVAGGKQDRLATLLRRRWRDTSLASMQRALYSMPKRLARVIEKKGLYLLRGIYY